MDIEELLRSSAPDPDAMRDESLRIRSAVLSVATASPPRGVGKSRGLVASVGVAITTLGVVGGVAYATENVPKSISFDISTFAQHEGVPARKQPAIRQVGEVTLPDGTQFAAWRAHNGHMDCTSSVDHWDGHTATGWGWTACAKSSLADDSGELAWPQSTDASTHYPVLVGATASADAVTVHITGVFAATSSVVDLTVPIDQATRSFAVLLPGDLVAPWQDGGNLRPSGLTLTYLDSAGHVTREVAGPYY